MGRQNGLASLGRGGFSGGFLLYRHRENPRRKPRPLPLAATAELFQKHAIPVAEEAVALADGVLVGGEDALASGEGRHQH